LSIKGFVVDKVSIIPFKQILLNCWNKRIKIERKYFWKIKDIFKFNFELFFN